VAYLAQDPVFKAGTSVLQAVLQSDSPMARAVQDYQRALAQADGQITKARRGGGSGGALWGAPQPAAAGSRPVRKCCQQAHQQSQQASKPASHPLPAQDLEAAIERMNSYNAWGIDAEAKRLLEAVGIIDANQSVDGVSGGGRGWAAARSRAA
jgi:ATP-binding cassette subfamily F protein uup